MTLLVAALVWAATLVVLMSPAAPLSLGPRASPPQRPGVDGTSEAARPRPRWLVRLTCAVSVACAGYLFLGGVVGVGAGALGAVLAWRTLARSVPGEVRRAGEQARDELPHVVSLVSSLVRSGADPAAALAAVAAAFPGPASERLRPAVARASLGDIGGAWALLATDEILGPLGRTLARAHQSGSPVAAAIERLADDLSANLRADAEDRARRVGVAAAIPLGVCLLPAFILLGIVPTVAGMLALVAP